MCPVVPRRAPACPVVPRRAPSCSVVLGATGVYWVLAPRLMFTSAEGDTQEVASVGWTNLAVSADRSVFATVDQSRGPTDEYGTHVLQVAAFDTRTGAQLYRTPDAEPDDGGDLADLYGEIMPARSMPRGGTSLGGWSGVDTFFGVAERIDQRNFDNVLRARQVVTCALQTLVCTPLSAVLPTEDGGQPSPLLVEGSINPL